MCVSLGYFLLNSICLFTVSVGSFVTFRHSSIQMCREEHHVNIMALITVFICQLDIYSHHLFLYFIEIYDGYWKRFTLCACFVLQPVIWPSAEPAEVPNKSAEEGRWERGHVKENEKIKKQSQAWLFSDCELFIITIKDLRVCVTRMISQLKWLTIFVKILLTFCGYQRLCFAVTITVNTFTRTN